MTGKVTTGDVTGVIVKYVYQEIKREDNRKVYDKEKLSG